MTVVKDKSTVEWLEVAGYDDCGLPFYSLDATRSKFEVRELLPGSAWLVLNRHKWPWLKFALLGFYQSDGEGKAVLTDCIFHGEGPSETLRECRHTYWGNVGYIFYPNGKAIAAAFVALGEFYDGMV